MKIVQSFWSKPLLQHIDCTNEINVDSKKNGGWLSEEIYYMSCALSVLKLREFYDEVELVTDSYGKKMLIDTLKLPFTSYNTSLDEINDYHEDLWAIGKLFAYKAQNTPFLHVDNDIFIWKKFDDNLTSSDFLVQNIELKYSNFNLTCKEILENFDGINSEMKDYLRNQGVFQKEEENNFNFGVFGGKQIEFIKYYVNYALDLINMNLHNISKITNKVALCMFFEQSIFYCLSVFHKKQVNPLFENIGYSDYIQNHFCHFENIPNDNYIHTIGTAKRNPLINEQVYINLLNEYPEYHKLIKDNFNN